MSASFPPNEHTAPIRPDNDAQAGREEQDRPVASARQPRARAGSQATSLRGLRRFTQEREQTRETRVPLEHCELCNDVLAPEHHHLLDLPNHALICACQACSLLFNDQGAGVKGKYRLIPSRYLILPDFHMADEQWEDLMIPVNMVYIFRSSEANRVMAFYPSPAGAIESLLSMESWEELVRGNSILNGLEPDVEALLINRVKDTREYYIVPIDACYQLVGLLRVNWRGLSGGEAVREAMAAFFADLRTKSVVTYSRGGPDARPEL